MPIIKIHVNCSERFSEVLFENEEEAAAIIEGVVGTALLELIDTVEVKRVIIHHSSDDPDRQGSDPFIKIHVNCSERSEILFENEEEAEAMIEDVVSTALLELFDTVHVRGVTIYHASDAPDFQQSLWI